jgi:hypothetical protein
LIAAGIRSRPGGVDMVVNGLLILLAVLGLPYLALNVRRLLLGRSWAFTVCQVAKEWAERDRAKCLATRAESQTGRPEPGHTA